MKNINIKSLLIGGLLASTILLGIAAVPRHTGTDGGPITGGQWDGKQEWHIDRITFVEAYQRLQAAQEVKGYEPFAVTDKHVYYRKRMK